MRIWLDQVQDEPFRWDETVSIAPATLDRPELLHLGPIHWRGLVTFADPGYYLQAKATYQQSFICIRCLKPIEEEAVAALELLILKERQPTAGGEHALQESELGVLYVGGEELDMDPILVEQLQLNIPMKPLCREDCKGLCPECGADRNTEACSCRPSSADPRWGPLAELKGRLAEKN